jgi:hypothetical protein
MRLRNLLVSIAAVLVSPVCLHAADAPAAATEAKPAAEAKSAPATEAKATPTAQTVPGGTVAEGTAKPAKPAYCQSSGRIRVRVDSKNGCDSAQKPYRSYSKDQLDTTGKMSIDEALEELDPIFHPN